MSRPQGRDLLFRGQRDEEVGGAVVVALDRELGAADAESLEQRRGLREWIDGRHRLLHPAEDDPAGLVALEHDRHVAARGLERDHDELERSAEHERRTQRRVPGERQLEVRA